MGAERKFRGGENGPCFRGPAAPAVAAPGLDQVGCISQERRNSIHLRIHLRPCSPESLTGFAWGPFLLAGACGSPHPP